MTKQLLNIDKEYAGKCIQGKRNYQEDDFGFDNSTPNDFLMILADGMGGHQGGAIASHCAVQTFMDNYYKVSGSVSERLWQALQQTNHQLAIETQFKPELKGMGCTLVVAVIHDEQLEWISIGDSPLWLYRAKQLRRLNADHSMKPILQTQVKRGELTPEQAANHPDRNVLFSALTGMSIELFDQSPAPLKLYLGDYILLASDGILSLSEQEISKILQKNLSVSAKVLVNKLLNAVQNKGRRDQDNATTLIVQIPDELGSKKTKSWRWQTGILLFLLILNLFLWTMN